jgi:heavy metal sensor kinase
MKACSEPSIRTRLTRWYIGVMTVMLIVFAAMVFVFQYSTLKRQIIHDEVQEVATVEGLLSIDPSGQMQLRQDYFSRPQSHLLIDRLMEVRDLDNRVVFRSDTLRGQPLGGPLKHKEGDGSFNERVVRLPDGTHVLVISHIHGIRGKDYVIRLGYSLAPLRARMWQFLLLLLAALLVMIVLTTLTGRSVARRVLSPLELMAARAEGISAQNLNDRLATTNTQDELGALAAAFNRLLERLEQAFQQLQRFTADAAHELRTPLASLRAVGEVAMSKPRSGEEYREAISSILEETNRLNETIESLLLLAKAETPNEENLEVVTLGPVLTDVVSVFSVLTEDRGIHIRYEDKAGTLARVRIDPALLRVALMNVVHNAIKFSPDLATIHCSIEFLPTPTATVRICIEDEGPGVSQVEAERLFDRFYTGRDSRTAQTKGTGLGLPIARFIVGRAHGTIAFDPSIDHGARCVLQFPAQT